MRSRPFFGSWRGEDAPGAFPDHGTTEAMSKSRPRRSSTMAVALVVLPLLVAAFAAADHLLSKQTSSTPTVIQVSTPVDSTATQLPATIHWQPTLRTGQLKILDKHGFTVGYNEQRKNPAWVIYELTGPISHPGAEPTRPATFATDFDTAAHVSHQDYSRSGYDRRHMAPAYALWSRGGKVAFLATFVCSNIIPQPHTVNAGIWEDLEIRIAGRWSSHGGEAASGGWAERYGAVTVINGPIYHARPDTLRAGIAIPDVDFSVVIRHDASGYQAMAFEIPNVGDPRGPLDRYLVSIKQVEDDAGLDVLAGVAENLRAQLETVRATALWP